MLHSIVAKCTRPVDLMIAPHDPHEILLVKYIEKVQGPLRGGTAQHGTPRHATRQHMPCRGVPSMGRAQPGPC